MCAHTHTEFNTLSGPFESFNQPHKAVKSTMLSFMLELCRWDLPPQLFISSVEIAQKTQYNNTPPQPPHPKMKFSAISKNFLGRQFRETPSYLDPYKLVSSNSPPCAHQGSTGTWSHHLKLSPVVPVWQTVGARISKAGFKNWSLGQLVHCSGTQGKKQ